VEKVPFEKRKKHLPRARHQEEYSASEIRGVRVEMLARHSSENSRPMQGEWVFEYTVRITNQGPETVQLIGRHPVITDGLDLAEEVEGPDVVGSRRRTVFSFTDQAIRRSVIRRLRGIRFRERRPAAFTA
jgi:hypothetical protein